MTDSRPDSSTSEQPAFNRTDAGSTPARGSTSFSGSSAAEHPHGDSQQKAEGANPSPRAQTYLYAVVRKELVGGALLAQMGHAVTECLRPGDLPLPADTRIVVLGATKEQLAEKRQALLSAGVHHAAILETDGVLAGVVTAIGLVTQDRDNLKPILGELRPYR